MRTPEAAASGRDGGDGDAFRIWALFSSRKSTIGKIVPRVNDVLLPLAAV
jgi:hypothetical protein